MGADGAVPALVLAAGLGTRYAAAGGEGPKVLAMHDGRPLLDHAVRCAVDGGCTAVTVVTHPALLGTSSVARLRQEHPTPGALTVVVNPHPEAGIGASLAVGLATLRGTTAQACVVLLADQPGVDPVTVAAVVAAWRTSGRPVRTRYRDGASHPVLLPRALWPELLAAPGGTVQGARGLLAAHDVLHVDVDRTMPRDVDTPTDLDHA